MDCSRVYAFVVGTVGVLLCLLHLVITLEIYLPFDSTNTSATYNEEYSIWYISPNTTIQIACAYSDVTARLATTHVRWKIGSKGRPDDVMFADEEYEDTTIASGVRPTALPKRPSPYSGTIRITLAKIEKKYYINTPEDPVATVQCQLVALNGTSFDSAVDLRYRANIDIMVVEPAIITDVSVTPSDLSRPITEGDTVILNCTASGLPTPEVVWSRADGRVLFNTIDGGFVYKGSTLTLTNVTEYAAGTYICSASNRVTTVAPTNSTVIQVLHKPVLEVHALVVYQKVNYHTEMKCSVKSSNPAPTTVRWAYRPASSSEGSELKYIAADDSRLQYDGMSKDNSTGVWSSMLTIAYVDKDDFNRLYCCVFTNSVGDRNTCMSVRESSKPVPVNGGQPKKGRTTSSSNQTSAHISLFLLVCVTSIFNSLCINS